MFGKTEQLLSSVFQDVLNPAREDMGERSVEPAALLMSLERPSYKKVQKKQSGYMLTQDAPFLCHKMPQLATMQHACNQMVMI